jgi:hypothetical protein
MQLGQTLRENPVPPPFTDLEPRTQCGLCCAAYTSFFAFACTAMFHVPCNHFTSPTKIKTIWQFLDRALLIPMPFAAGCFTHQYMVSQALWSKNEKVLFDVNYDTLFYNAALWASLVGGCTWVSRNVLPKHSRKYRLLLWDYRREYRTCHNRYMPTCWGSCSEHLDWYAFLWWVQLYHLFWFGFSMAMESGAKMHYGMLIGGYYSKSCSPRWREWREVKIQTELAVAAKKEEESKFSRWGNLLTLDDWRGY